MTTTKIGSILLTGPQPMQSTNHCTITCPECSSVFSLETFPEAGRELLCGHCGHVWNYRREEEGGSNVTGVQEDGLAQYLIDLTRAGLDSLTMDSAKKLATAWSVFSQAEGVVDYVLATRSQDLSPNLRAELMLLNKELHAVVDILEEGQLQHLDPTKDALYARLRSIEGFIRKDITSTTRKVHGGSRKEKPVKIFSSSLSRRGGLGAALPIKPLPQGPLKARVRPLNVGRPPDESSAEENFRQRQKIRLYEEKVRAEQEKDKKTEEELSKGHFIKAEEAPLSPGRPLPVGQVATANYTGVAIRRHNPVGGVKDNQQSIYVRKIANEDDLAVQKGLPSFLKKTRSVSSNSTYSTRTGDAGNPFVMDSSAEEGKEGPTFSPSFKERRETRPLRRDEPLRKIELPVRTPAPESSRSRGPKGESRWPMILTAIIIVVVALLAAYLIYAWIMPRGGRTTFRQANGQTQLSAAQQKIRSMVQIVNPSGQFLSAGGGRNVLVVSGRIRNLTSSILRSVTLRIQFRNGGGNTLAEWNFTLRNPIKPNESRFFTTRYANVPNVRGMIQVQAVGVS